MIDLQLRLSTLRKKDILSVLFLMTFFGLISFALLFKLNDYPTVWWDEGWTLSAARNWIVHGHLGNYIDGQPVPPRIPLRFPVAVPVAISMKLFGIGIWQGRLPGVIFTIGTLLLYGYLISKMYTRKTGIAAQLIAVCLSPYMFNPIISGRQIMAEMPMMFYLLGGYSLVWLALTRHKLWGIGAALLFGIAIHAKLQVPPFWIVSMGLAFLVAVKHRHWNLVRLLSWIAVGSIASAIIVFLIQNSLMPGSFADQELLKLLLNTSVLSLTWSIRERAIYIAAIFALPILLGYIWAGRRILRTLFVRNVEVNEHLQTGEINKEIMRAAIWGLGASWLVWYITMSSYWIRYLLPAYFIGIIFITAFVGEHTQDFNLGTIFPQTARLLFRGEVKKKNIIALTFILIFSVSLGLMLGTFRILFPATKWQPEVAAQYIQENIPLSAKVETYESELLFLAPEFNYHLPPDLVSMELYRRADINLQYAIDYDPIKAKPDYLVVGPFAQTYGLYSDQLINEWFDPVTDIGGYQIYHIKNSKYGDS